MKRISRLSENRLTDWVKNLVKKGKQKINVRTGIKTGHFVTMNYASKMYEEDKLDFYDQQPLILVLGQNSGYVQGLNFHYVKRSARLKIINKLKKLRKKAFKENKPLPNLQWSSIASEVKYATFMIKLYIKDRIMKPQLIKNTDIHKVIHLPSEDFIGIDADKLWRSLGM